jgi:NAD(P)H-hydrate epimerase
MPRPALTREQSRELDRRAIEELGISGLVLMENAGRGCVDVMERIGIHGPVAILCGKGNNAGDGFVIARHLETRGYECRVLLLSNPNELRGDAATNFSILQRTDVQIVNLCLQRAGASARLNLSNASPPSEMSDATWLVDALLGTGTQGDPRPPFDTAIDWINARAAKTQSLAVDVPSGLDCDTGLPSAHTVRADHTCTFAAMKTGLALPAARPFTGTIHVCDIGLPPELIDEVPGNAQLGRVLSEIRLQADENSQDSLPRAE